MTPRTALCFLNARSRPIAWVVALLVTSLGVTVNEAMAQPGQHEEELSWDRNIRGLYRRYCYSCHSDDDPSGDVDLASDEDLRRIRRNRATWLQAGEVLADQQMPPEDAKQPSEEERSLMIRFVEATLAELPCEEAIDPGRPVLRRLNRTEYDHAVEDLTGLTLRLGQTFPPEPEAYGFDNIGDALTLSPMQVEQYHDAAKAIVSAVRESKGSGSESAYDRVYFVQPDDATTEAEAAEQIVTRFATSAFRRPVEPQLVDQLMNAYRQARDQGVDHETAVGYLLTGVLVSPRFLMLVEADQPEAEGPYEIDSFELANRLSFFLWSRPPDETLMETARRGELQNLEVLREQTMRLLADDRSDALVENFCFQWLGLRGLDTYQPDAKVFPEFDEGLRQAMRQELRHLFAAIVRENRPITEVVDASYTFLNERLAQHYGRIDAWRDAGGADRPEQFVRVSMADARRGGVLTSAAVLMLQSDPTRTNIPRRGTFIAGRILGSPPPPPPPNVPPLGEEQADLGTMSLRQILELHRSKPACEGCHSRIDPFGFALENYDAIGRWRDQDGGQPIDASADLPTGDNFVGPTGLKDFVAKRQQDFVRGFVENLLIYALGRGMTGDDACLVKEVRDAAEAGDYRFQEMTWAIVKSRPFRSRRNPDF